MDLKCQFVLCVNISSIRPCPVLFCLIQQQDDWESGLHFLPASDSRGLEKKPGRTKKLWVGLGLLLAAVSVALLTGLLVWHFHRELPLINLYYYSGNILSDMHINMKAKNLMEKKGNTVSSTIFVSQQTS